MKSERPYKIISSNRFELRPQITKSFKLMKCFGIDCKHELRPIYMRTFKNVD